jgi:hypothetical protein
MSGTHSPLSPSGAHRYFRCPDAPNAERGLPDHATPDAALGTVFHEVAALCLELGMEPEDFRGAEIEADGFVFSVDDDMIRYMQYGLRRSRELAATGEMFVEKRVDISPWLGDGESGTTDVGIVNVRDREITMLDWKYGQGVPVSPENNEQELLYVLGFWNDIASKLLHSPEGVKVRLIIEQPRCEGGGGEWETTMEEVLAFGEIVKEKVAATKAPNPPRVAGEKQCKFCKARKQPKGCYAYNDFNVALLGLAFDDIDDGVAADFPPPLEHPHDLTPERRAYIAQHAEMLTGFLKTIKAHVLQDYLAGRPTPGIKVVAGRRGHRKYQDDAADKVEAILVKELGDEAFTKTPISPAQAEKKLSINGFKMLSRFVVQGQAKPSIAPISSKKEAITSFDQMFDDSDID